jgi:hypothetical protein
MHAPLPMCINPTINNTRITKHNKEIWLVHKLLFSHSGTREFSLQNSLRSSLDPPPVGYTMNLHHMVPMSCLATTYSPSIHIMSRLWPHISNITQKPIKYKLINHKFLDGVSSFTSLHLTFGEAHTSTLLQTYYKMMHPLHARPCMHATTPCNFHQIPHPPHAQ